MKHVYDKDFVYVPVKNQDSDYLKRKFAKIKKEQQAAKKETEAKVKPIAMWRQHG